MLPLENSNKLSSSKSIYLPVVDKTLILLLTYNKNPKLKFLILTIGKWVINIFLIT